ncbi:MAG: tail fiber domain-containing protein [Desulfobacterales bacterium]|nr:tail fiber domain-containing protein [Desulfobacterales bacterium]
MKNEKRVYKSLIFVASFACLAIIACSAAVSADYFPGAAATVTAHPDRLDFEPNRADVGLTLTVSGAGGAYYSATSAPGDAPSFALVDNAGNQFPDGAATYELQANPVVDANARGDVEAEPARGASQSGAFSIVDGAIVYSAGGGGPAADFDPADGPVLEDHVINDDLIVDGSACIGFDCVNGESFGFDTIRLKENNLRIKFDDTSVAASYPRNDWQLTANDSANGGASKFSIDDITGGRTPFTVEAGAPSHSLYVDDGGRIGLGTSIPSVELHAVDGDTPTLRLQQDGSSGFAPQTWDVAGNETNFFVRDVTNGSQLPFRIRPDAPTNSLHIAADGNVGLGTASPVRKLDIYDTGAAARVAFHTDDSGTGAGDGSLIGVDDGDPGHLYVWNFENSSIYFGANDETHMILESDGELAIGRTAASHPIHMGSNANNAYLASTGVWHDSSSREYKENIKPVRANEAFDALKKLEPVHYTYKVDSEDKYVGFIAEDVPEMVATKDRKTMVPMDIVAVLTKVVQEQQKTIAENTKVFQEQQKTIAENTKVFQEQQKTIEEYGVEIAKLKR